MIDLKIWFIFYILICCISCSHKVAKLDPLTSPPEKNDFAPDLKRKMVLDLKHEIERLDGDGLLPRNKKPISWDQTILRLSEEAANSRTPFQLGLVFKKIDATYTNLHAKVYLSSEYQQFSMKIKSSILEA